MSSSARLLLVCAALLGCSGSSGDAPAVCGDGVAAGDEACDGADLRGRRCADLGFNDGALACHATCVLDARGCATVELCDNGRDDDGDGDKDCDDAGCADAPACASCGDGRVSGAETCDDGNAAAGDCCASCRAEAGCEFERNDTTATAAALAAPAGVRGWIAPAGDADVFAVTVPAGSTGTVSAEVSAWEGTDACFGTVDSLLEVVAPDGRSVAVDDDAGTGTCSRVRGAGLAPGPAFVRVTAGPYAASATFAYHLAVAVELSPCGDGVLQEGQECDDGNPQGGDGCSAGCRLEDVAEVEPNGGRDTAGGPLRAPFAVAGAIDPPAAGNVDEDWFAVDVAAAASLRLEVALVNLASCDTRVVTATLVTAAGQVLGATDAGGANPRSCGGATIAVDAGRVYLRVASRPAPGRYRVVATAVP